MWTPIIAMANALRSRWDTMNETPDAGYVSETVLTTALLVVGALVAMGIIMAKVNAAANEINLGYVILSVVR